MSNYSPVLKTDAYEMTMLSSLIRAGKADDHSVFELFARKLPSGRRFGLTAGLGRFIEHYRNWDFKETDLNWLISVGMLTEEAADWLIARGGFNGTIRAFPEGALYNPYSPIVQVEGALGECILLETMLLSIFNHDCAVASAAARMTIAAEGTPIIEMGSRRTEERAAVSAARATYIAGFAGTSNIEAGLRYGVPVKGTAAHAYTLAFDDGTDQETSEFEAFVNQLRTWGTGTTLLVDTYDTPRGIRNAVRAAQQLGASGPGAIRIDSGDLIIETAQARELLDELGAVDTGIIVSSDLDEYLIRELSASPIDGFGVGTRVVTGSGHPTASMVYKLVEINGNPVEKKANGKGSIGGKKTPYRVTVNGATKEYFSLDGSVPEGAIPLYRNIVEGGEVVGNEPITDARNRAAIAISGLSKKERLMSDGKHNVTATWDGTVHPSKVA